MVRVRIAPSPTGFAHIGLARTALFNYLFAKKNGGAFVLRIEDTDKERSKREYEDGILSNLKWLGIRWDEGPDIGGDYGPYRQSERGHIYKDYLLKLAEEKRLYKCYCTREELEQEKQEQMLAKLPPRYSGKCRKLSESAKAEFDSVNKEYTLRFCLEPQTIVIQDLIRGTVTFDTALMDDFIIAKDFDTPLYNFAVVIDDALMKITHILRGEEHLSNTPKQIQLARALGLDIPVFGHLPLILDSDRKKMSKRENKTAIDEYKIDGYLSEALINFIALLGWNPGGEQELFSLSDLEQQFDITHINKSGSIFDVQKLDWFNGYYIRHHDNNDLAELCIPYFIQAGYIREENDNFVAVQNGTHVTKSYIGRIVSVERGRIKKLAEITTSTANYFYDELNYAADLLQWKETTTEDTIKNLEFARELLLEQEESNWNIPYLEELFRNEIVKTGKKNGEILSPLRVALSGLQSSPSPFEIAWILGKEQTDIRIRQAIHKLNKP